MPFLTTPLAATLFCFSIKNQKSPWIFDHCYWSPGKTKAEKRPETIPALFFLYCYTLLSRCLACREGRHYFFSKQLD